MQSSGILHHVSHEFEQLKIIAASGNLSG